VVVIEHNLEVIKTADWVLDMGPEGGDGGGYVVAEGTPETIAAHAQSHTGRFLAPLLPTRAAAPAKFVGRTRKRA
jgi:excinuclease ABC subunit A